MTDADILWEYRQMKALDYEKKHGKPLEEDVVVDESFDDYLEELGVAEYLEK